MQVEELRAELAVIRGDREAELRSVRAPGHVFRARF